MMLMKRKWLKLIVSNLGNIVGNFPNTKKSVRKKQKKREKENNLPSFQFIFSEHFFPLVFVFFFCFDVEK